MMRHSVSFIGLVTIPLALIAACGEEVANAPPGDGTPDAALDGASPDGGSAGDANVPGTDAGATDSGPDAAPVMVTLGGTILGLQESTGDAGLADAGSGGLVLGNGADQLTLFGNGTFAFTTKIAAGSSYDVTVEAQPSNPYQACTVSGGKGIAGTADITSVTVNCDPSKFTIGGSAAGIANGGTLTLRLNDSVDVAVTNAAGTYAFGTSLASGTPYSVAVKTNPVDQTCTVENASGIVVDAPITDVNVSCVDDFFALSVDVSGYAGSTPLELANGVDTIDISANGVASFPTKVARGGGYAIVASALPTSPSQDCTIGDSTNPAAGSMTAARTVPVSCVTKPFKITGTVKGKRAPAIELTSGSGVNVTVANNGAFEFPGMFLSGTALNVAVATPPGTQKCFVDGGAVTVGNSDVAVTVTCYDEIAFAGAGAPAVTDFQVPLTLTTAAFDYARAQAQGQDIRFVAAHGGAPVPYYIDRWDSAGDSVLWVKVPAIAAGGSTKLLMFAGDAGLAAASSGDATFEFFDDFSSAAADPNKWDVRGTPSTNAGTNGKLTFRGSQNWEYARSKTSFTSGVVEADFETKDISAGLLLGHTGTDSRYTFRVASGSNDGTTYDADVAGGNSWFDMAYPGITRGPDNTARHETMKVSVDGGGNIVVSEICNVTASVCSGAKTLNSSTGTQFFVGFSTYAAQYTIVMDRLFVRKLAVGTFTATFL